MKFTSYCTFYIHFRSIRGFIFSPSLTINVQLIQNRILRILKSQQAKCEKVNDNLENVAYLCKVYADVSTVNTIKIDSEFNFESQDITIIGISPIAQKLMENIIDAEGKYNSLLESYIYVLDHSIISSNNKNNIFKITGIIEGKKPNFKTFDLLLKINVENEKDKIETDIKCKIIEIKGSNYALSCQGENDILYNLQSAVSFFDKDLLLINFDENTNRKILFESSFPNNNKIINKSDSKGINSGVIFAIVLVTIVVLSSIITFIILRKRAKGKKQNVEDSNIVVLKNNFKHINFYY